jgi:biopolymer transport protein TolR
MGARIEAHGRRGQERANLADINVTPFVDVVLVLLIIFMVTAPLMQRGVDVDLPRAESAAGQEEQRIIVTIDRTERVFLNETSMGLADLEKHLATVKGGIENPFVYLRADQSVPYGRVMEVMDRIKLSGISRVGLVTDPNPSRTSVRPARTSGGRNG